MKIVETKEQGNYGIGLWVFQGIGVLEYCVLGSCENRVVVKRRYWTFAFSGHWLIGVFGSYEKRVLDFGLILTPKYLDPLVKITLL